MSATGGFAKAVVQIALVEWRDRIDRAFRFIDSKERHFCSGGGRGETKRDRVTSRREDHQAIYRTSSAPKLVKPCNSRPKRRVDVWLQLALAHADAGQPLPAISNHKPRVHTGQMPAVVSGGNSLLDSSPCQVSFNHRRKLARKLLPGLRRLSNADASTQCERASFDPHLLRAFECQSFGREFARNDSPRARPAIAPARQDQLAIGEFGRAVAAIQLRQSAIVLEQIELAAKEE